jgi:hypothetical protein
MTRRWIWLVRSKIWVILASHLDGAAINGSVTVLIFCTNVQTTVLSSVPQEGEWCVRRHGPIAPM